MRRALIIVFGLCALLAVLWAYFATGVMSDRSAGEDQYPGQIGDMLDRLEPSGTVGHPRSSHVDTARPRYNLRNVYVPSGVAGFLRPGDRVDLYGTASNGITALVVTNVRLAQLPSGLPDPGQVRAALQMDMVLEPTAEQRAALDGIAPDSVVTAFLVGAADDVSGAALDVSPGDLLGIEDSSGKKTSRPELTAEDIIGILLRGEGSGKTRGLSLDPGSAPSPSPDPAQALVDQLKAADLAFNRPARMTYGAAVRVELVLAPDEVSRLADLPADASTQARAEAVGLTAELAGETRVVEDVRYATRMQAVLSGPDFDVDPPGPQARTVLPDAAATWVWTVKPKAHGDDKLLTLDVQAIVERNGKDMPPAQIRVFREIVPVDITLWGRLVVMSAEIKAVHGMLAALGGTVLAGLGWLWKRRKAQAPALGPEPLEVIVTHKSGD